ncbi:MAG: tRNA (adenosine(37)-N6)-threonylcarbamoyltransferase complex ATPase subunit type 1 TsaE [Candidatus Parcubacteria bacterium]|nr:MAG: tRNA (adenosine(37)-N6)-threonylcarbamoyltransferase complex ATPase subunit type 1 TsaE [Candidatus Parcubacteria bacterium]
MLKITVKDKNNKKVVRTILKMLPTVNIFLFNGRLGAGKTTLIKEIAKSLKIKEPLTSPTFILWQKYIFRFKNKTRFFNHLDLYRIYARDLKKINFLPELNDKRNYFFIEWGFKLKKFLKNRNIKFQEILINKTKNGRVFIIK